MPILRFAALGALVLAGTLSIHPAQAMSLSDCSVQYRAAQAAGTLGGMKWNDFIKAKCASDGAAAGDAGAAAASGPSAGTGSEIVKVAATTSKSAPKAKPVPPEGVVFPKAIDPKFASETPTRARMHTCLAQYKIDKANDGLKGLKWIQSGGGYYSICNALLKG